MKGQPHRGDGAKVVEGGPLQDQKRRALPGFQMAGIAGIGAFGGKGDVGMQPREIAHQPFIGIDAVKVDLFDAGRGGGVDPAILDLNGRPSP